MAQRERLTPALLMTATVAITVSVIVACSDGSNPAGPAAADQNGGGGDGKVTAACPGCFPGPAPVPGGPAPVPVPGAPPYNGGSGGSGGGGGGVGGGGGGSSPSPSPSASASPGSSPSPTPSATPTPLVRDVTTASGKAYTVCDRERGDNCTLMYKDETWPPHGWLLAKRVWLQGFNADASNPGDPFMRFTVTADARVVVFFNHLILSPSPVSVLMSCSGYPLWAEDAAGVWGHSGEGDSADHPDGRTASFSGRDLLVPANTTVELGPNIWPDGRCTGSAQPLMYTVSVTAR